jgi:carboxyl-terminal processing protease
MKQTNFFKIILNNIVVFLFFLFYLELNAQIDTTTEKEINFQASKFKYLLEMATKYYYDSLSYEKVSDAAFHSLLKALDPQSLYFSKTEYEKLSEANKGESEGIGIDIVPLQDTLTIISVFKDSPADSAGLLPGDKVLFINGKSVLSTNKADADNLIKGASGTKVQLIIKRHFNSSALNEYVITRSEFNLPSITAYFLLEKTNIGYIQITRFSNKTDQELKQALNSLAKNGMNKLIIDLRGNYGGILEATLKSLGFFLPKGTKLLQIKSHSKDFDTTFYSTSEQVFNNLKVAILVDKNSASASEILAGVMQDYDDAIIVGERTFGKGTVQRIWKLNDSTAFRLTVAEYITPSGRKIQKQYDSVSMADLDPSMQLNLDTKTREEILNTLRQFGGKSQIPVYYSADNRVILGGGGVFPDISVTSDTLTLLTRVLIQKGIFLEFIYQFLATEKDKIIQNYNNNFKIFNDKFQITEEIIKNFKNCSISRNIWNETYFQKDKDYIATYLKAIIGYTIWGENAYKLALLGKDNVFDAAVKAFADYAKILNKKE